MHRAKVASHFHGGADEPGHVRCQQAPALPGQRAHRRRSAVPGRASQRCEPEDGARFHGRLAADVVARPQACVQRHQRRRLLRQGDTDRRTSTGPHVAPRHLHRQLGDQEGRFLLELCRGQGGRVGNEDGADDHGGQDDAQPRQAPLRQPRRDNSSRILQPGHQPPPLDASRRHGRPWHGRHRLDRGPPCADKCHVDVVPRQP
mmetsp:Transcript_47617/g.136990  ORF Transcript_47617/g.136990 Transcript_47617/m.136990 type:complete len:203 (-) Transcript_47617:1110-1718(-)